MINNYQEKLNELIKKTLPKLSKSLIYITDDNRYVLFEKYVINDADVNNIVVNRLSDEKIFMFGSVRNAVAWAVLDKNLLFYEADRIRELDHKIRSLMFDSRVQIKIKRNKNDLDKYSIALNKYDSAQYDIRKFRKELDKYIHMANCCQLRGFENEIIGSTRK